MDWLKTIALGILQKYIYDETDDLVAWIKYYSDDKGYITDDGGFEVRADEVLDFVKIMLKSLGTIIRKGSPPPK